MTTRRGAKARRRCRRTTCVRKARLLASVALRTCINQRNYLVARQQERSWHDGSLFPFAWIKLVSRNERESRACLALLTSKQIIIHMNVILGLLKDFWRFYNLAAHLGYMRKEFYRNCHWTNNDIWKETILSRNYIITGGFLHFFFFLVYIYF